MTRGIELIIINNQLKIKNGKLFRKRLMSKNKKGTQNVRPL